MNNNYIVLLIALICAVLLLSVPSGWTGLMGDKGGVEGFMTYFGFYKQYCASCNWRSPESCLKCTNCGICVKDGQSKCISGSSDGPFFSENCDSYQYGTSDYYAPGSSYYPVALTKTFWPNAKPSVRVQYRWN